MFSRIALAILPLLASAAPTAQPDFISSLLKRDGLADDFYTKLSTCDISAIKMDPLGLQQPPAGYRLDHIALGRGTQNYTCADASENTKPVAQGAVAVLYNVTCMAGPYPGLLDALPSVALKYPIPTDEQLLGSSASKFFLGHHYFQPNNTTPVFNLNTPNAQYGIVALGKLDANNATTRADVNVQNLQLGAKSRDGCQVQQVYRLHSEGGQPPATCKGMPAAFEVQYATNYWFWSDPAGNLRTGAYAAPA